MHLFKRLRARRAHFVLFLSVALLVVALHSPASSRERRANVDGCATRLQLTEATPIGVGPCDGVRPGGFHRTKIGGCTWNFLFEASDGHRYMGTAGHCLIPDGEKVWRGKGDRVKGLIDGEEVPVGRSVYAIDDFNHDFGLVRLDKGVVASPKMCHFGGPSRGPVDPSPGTLLHHYGNGLLFGDTVPARTSVAADVVGDSWFRYAAGPASPGDSGSAVITEEGNAVGVLVHLSVFGVGISRLEPHLELAEEKLGIDLTLQTAPLSE